MSMWKRAMEYLGLGPDDAYDDYEPAPEPERPARGARSGRDDGRAPRGGYGNDYEPDGSARPAPQRQSFPTRDHDLPRRPTPASDESNVQPRPMNARPTVAPRATAVGVADPYTVRPRRFDSAQEIADKFKEGQPVIMNLEAAERDVSRRLIDFASGLCYGLNGTMEKVASGVYLLKPLPRPTGYDSHDFGA